MCHVNWMQQENVPAQLNIFRTEIKVRVGEGSVQLDIIHRDIFILGVGGGSQIICRDILELLLNLEYPNVCYYSISIINTKNHRNNQQNIPLGYG